MEGIVTHTHRFSALRIAPACTHFGICGGCKWQNLPYEKQLEFKQQEINDNLQRIGKIMFIRSSDLPANSITATS